MKNFASFVVVAALTGSVGLGQASDPEIVPGPPEVRHRIEVAKPVNKLEACPTWRRLALKTSRDSECPILDPVTWQDETTGSDTTGSWTVGHLFTANQADLEEFTTGDGTRIGRASADYAKALPPALRPFCLYVYQENEPQVLELLNNKLDELIATQSNSKTFERIDDGCAAVGPASDQAAPFLPNTSLLCEPNPPRPPSWIGLESFFLGQIGNVEPVTNRGPRNTPHEGPGVRLSLLDTQPTVAPSCGATSAHGAALARIAHEITCNETGTGPDSCTAEVETRLALPILSFDRMNPKGTIMSPNQGGLSGFVDQLATEVWNAVRDHNSVTPTQHHVLNLSVAWDGSLFSGLEGDVSQMGVAVQAMYRALQVASCRGTLVVAAAGNSTDGPDQKPGPLLPGGWEDRDAPNGVACHQLLGLRGKPQRSDRPPEPLVYSVAGVRSDGSPLYNTRPGATPPRVAFGDHAWVRGTPQVKPLTGSSSATTVVSSTASLVWHHWPELPRAELMALLYEAGEDLKRPADFYHRSSGSLAPPEVRRISVCSALNRACDELGGDCFVDCTQPAPSPPKLAKSCGPGSLSIDASTFTQQLGTISLCGPRKIFYDPTNGFPTHPCLNTQFYGASAWPWRNETCPQPETEPCMGCGPIDPDTQGDASPTLSISSQPQHKDKKDITELVIRIDHRWTRRLTHAFLDINDFSLALGVHELNGESCLTVRNFKQFIKSRRLPYITLRFLTDDQRVVSAPVLYEHKATPITADRQPASVLLDF